MKKDSFIKDALILFAITLVAGIALGGAYEITKGPIEAARMEAKSAAYRVVYEDASEFRMAEEFDELVAASETDLASANLGRVYINEVVKAVDAAGSEIGYVVTSTSKEGYGGEITMTVGISADGKVQGIEFLTINETVGFGAKANEPDFKNQFKGKNANVLSFTGSGASADDEVDAIGGATITSNAVLNATNAALYFVNNTIGQ